MSKKIIYTLLITISLFILNIEAQPVNNKKTELISKSCYNSLTSDNAGVVESAIFISMQFKNSFPNEDDEKFIDALDDIAKNSTSPVISYKAQLARIYFKNIYLFKTIEVKSIEYQDLVFEQIAIKINSIMLANNN